MVMGGRKQGQMANEGGRASVQSWVYSENDGNTFVELSRGLKWTFRLQWR